MAGSVSPRVWTSIATITVVVAATFYIEDRLEKKIDKTVSTAIIGVIESAHKSDQKIAELQAEVTAIREHIDKTDYHYKASSVALGKLVDFINQKFGKEFIKPDDITNDGER